MGGEEKRTMALSARKHPDYPFRDEHLEATIRLVDTFHADPPLSPIERGEVLEFVRMTHQYAFLEKLIQGEVRFELPAHLGQIRQTYASIEKQAEEVAAAERSLLGLGLEPAEDLPEALDDRGIKVLRRDRGPESPETLTGAFHYPGAHGPAILVGAVEKSRDAVFILAHEYGHLVMDVDPYASRFCRWRLHDLENANPSKEERRADRFARALLLPEKIIRECCGSVGAEEHSPEAIGRGAEVFDVSPALLWRRLEDLKLTRPVEAPPVGGRRRHKVDELRPTDLPERFVNLALAAYAGRVFEMNDLSRFLRVAPERLENFLTWCQVPRELKREDFVVEEEEG
jgi:Zn-dependent peptidase ImmA (M78 family)